MPKSGKRVLVVEDEFLIRTVVVETLEDNGFDVLEAASGSEAISMIKTAEDLAMLVTNINMPGASGIEVAAAARLRYPDLPVLFVSASPEQLATSPHTPQTHHYLAKPFDTRDLAKLVQSLTQSAA